MHMLQYSNWEHKYTLRMRRFTMKGLLPLFHNKFQSAVCVMDDLIGSHCAVDVVQVFDAVVLLMHKLFLSSKYILQTFMIIDNILYVSIL